MKQKCKYSRHSCKRYRYRNYKYCFQHILEDKSAPFMPCQYISKITKRRCHNPALKLLHSSLALCDIHQRPAFTASTYKSKRAKKSSSYENRDSSEFADEFDDVLKVPDYYKNESSNASTYDYDASLNGDWLTTISPNWNYGEVDIDTDSGEEEENPLMSTDILTLEEVVSISKQRLVKLKSLYIKQFGHLRRQLQSKRRKFLLNETTNPISSSGDIRLGKNADEKKEELNSLLNFRRHRWQNHLLHRKSKIKRLESTTNHAMMHVDSLPSPNKVKCCHVTNHVKCKSACLPYTKYCNAHILEDPLQVMYKKCSIEVCNRPVCQLWSYNKANDDQPLCSIHQRLTEISNDLVLMMNDIKQDLNRISPQMKNQLESENIVQNPAYTQPMFVSSPNHSSKSESFFADETSTAIKEKHFEESTTNAQEPNKSDHEAIGKPSPNKATSSSLSNTISDLKQLSPASMELFKTGQHYLMNKISVVDGAGFSPKEAIHLEPVDISVSLPEKPLQVTVPDVSAHLNEKSMGSRDLKDNKEACSTSANSKVSEEESKTQNKRSAHKVTAAATVVPPIDGDCVSESYKRDNRSASENELLRKMPALASLDVIESDGKTKSSTTDEDVSSPMDVDVVPEQSSSQSATYNQTRDRASSDETYSLETITQPANTLSADLDDSSSNEASKNIKGGDADEVNFVGERKPSSADEETAIASLLFLSSGTLEKH